MLEIAFGTTEPRKAHLFELSELHRAVEFAARVNRAGYQVYVGMALRKPGIPISRRAGKKVFYGSFWAWLDDAADWAKAAAAARDCPPDVIVCTGQEPSWRGQYLWRFIQPVTDVDRLESLNRGIERQLGGEDVHNCDRLMRMAGTVNWPLKTGRTVPELVTLRWANGASSFSDFETARRTYTTPTGQPTGPTAPQAPGPSSARSISRRRSPRQPNRVSGTSPSAT